MILVREVRIGHTIRNDIKDEDLEFLCVQISKPKVKPFLVSTWYRPPNSSIHLFEKFQDLLDKVESLGIENNIIGDLNCNVSANGVDNNTHHLLELTELYQYTQLIKEPTRITSSSSTLIDLFLTNEPNNFMTAGVSTIGISDENNFKRDIESVPWHFVGSYDDPIKAWETWKKFFLQIANKHAPIKKRRVRKISAPWLTAEIKKLMWERDHLKRKAVITKDESDWLSFKTKKNLVNYKIRNSKQQYYNSYFSNNVGRTKETWKGINSILSKAKKSIKIPKIVVNGSEISDPEAISNAFNEYFTEIGPNLAAQIPTNTSSAVDNINRNDLVFELHEVSTVQISRLVDKLSICKASGLDNISVRLLKSSAPTIIPSLTYIINLVICKVIIQADWKSARVSAIYKNDSKLDLNNYRPISVLPVIAKVFEKVVFDQTYNFLNDNDLLSKEQSGFRHLHFTLTAMLDATDQWYTNMDNGLINAILFVDLKKAFDTIDHEILLGKLNRYGFSNQTVELFRNYLSGRTQITVINNVSSGSCEITCGVPQGSILGPLLHVLTLYQ